MHRAQYAIAGIHLIHHNAKCVDIHDVVKGFALAAHLAINAIEVLFATTDFTGNLFASEAVGDRLLNLIDQLFTITPGFTHRHLNPFGTHRMHGFEA